MSPNLHQLIMKRLDINPIVIENLKFNTHLETLDIEFKKTISKAKQISIPLYVIENFIEQRRHNHCAEAAKPPQSQLKIVHSNFKVTSA